MKRLTIVVACLSVGSVLLFGFQNCSQPGTIALSTKIDNSSLSIPTESLDVDLSKSSPPPLKLVIVTDNSESMRLSQLNLKKSITAMFDGQSKNISEFDTEIFLISTAQLSNFVQPSSFFDTMITADAVAETKTMNDLNTYYRTPASVNGKIAGDALGFRRELVTSGGRSSYVFLPTAVSQFVLESGNKLKNIPSIKFKKGDSIDVITQGIADRLNTLDPNRLQKTYDLMTALDKESGLCTMARILKNNSGFINQGDLASFLVISDENDVDLAKECIQSLNTDLLYNVDCKKYIPASKTNNTKISYTIPGTDGSYETTFSVTPKDVLTPRKNTTLNVAIASKNALCSGTYHAQFKATFAVNSPRYKISYIKTPTGPAGNPAVCQGNYQKEFNVTYTRVVPRYKIKYYEEVYVTTRLDSGQKVYQDPVLKESNPQNGTQPNVCDNDEVGLRNKVGTIPASSRLSGIDCVDIAADNQTGQVGKFAFSAIPTASFGTAANQVCSADVVNALKNASTVAGNDVINCQMSKLPIAIPSNLITGFNTTTGTDADCATAVSNVCSNTNFRDCVKTNYTAYQPINYQPGPETTIFNAGEPTTANCSVATLRTLLNDNTSTLNITDCTDENVADELITPSGPKTLNYTAFPTVDINASTDCTDAIKTELLKTYLPNATIASCTLSRVTPALTIPVGSTTIASLGTDADCLAKVENYCSSSSGARHDCVKTGYTAGVAGQDFGSKTATADNALDCTAKCSVFPGLCDSGSDSMSVSAWAATKSAACSRTNLVDSPTEKYYKPQATQTGLKTTLANVISCDNTCAVFPGACGGNTGNVAIKDYNKSCAVTATRPIPGAAEKSTDLGSVEDKDKLITCDTKCADSKGLCGADKTSKTIAQYITSLSASNKNCVASSSEATVDAQTLITPKVDVLEGDIIKPGFCAPEYAVDMDTKKANGKNLKSTDYVVGNNGADPAMNLTDYITQRLEQLVGKERSSVNVFITMKDEDSATTGTTWGEAYQKLAGLMNGSTNNIKDESYEPALRNLSEVLRDQLQRSLTVKEVKSNAKIIKVWRKSKASGDWGQPLAANQWTSTGNTITFNQSLVLNWDDEIRIEYYY